MTLSRSDMKLGLRVAAPIKRGEHKRLYEECETAQTPCVGGVLVWIAGGTP